MLKAFGLITEWLARAGFHLSCAVMLAMMALVVANAVTRFVGLPIFGTLEVSAHYFMAGLAFLPLGFLQLQDRHLSVEVVAQFVGGRMRLFLDAGISLLAMAFLAFFIIATCEEAVEKTARGAFVEAGSHDLSIWASFWILPLGGVTIFLAFAFQFLTSALKIFGAYPAATRSQGE